MVLYFSYAFDSLLLTQERCPFYELSIGFHALIVTLQPILISEVMGSDCAYLVSVSDFKFTLEY